MNPTSRVNYVIPAGILGTLLIVWWLFTRRTIVEGRTTSTLLNKEPNHGQMMNDMSSYSKKWFESIPHPLTNLENQGVRDPYQYIGETRWITLNIDSRDRDIDRFPHPDTYEVQLSEPLRHVIRARLVTAEIPSTYYVFTESLYNTVLYVTAFDTEKVVQIPNGNYGIEDMVSTLESILHVQFPSAHFKVYADPVTHRLGIQSISNPITPFSIRTEDYLDGKIHWGLSYYLGFPRNTILLSENGKIEGTRPITLNPEMYMMLDILEFGSMHEMGVYGTSRLSGTKPFAKIPISAPSFHYNFLDEPSGVNEMHPPIQQVDKLSIRLRFHDGTPVSFEDVNHSMTLEVLCTRGRNV